jgi:DNA-binding transcriptional ArsR family regulator
MGKVQELGGKVPEDAVREVVENLIHAGYRGVVISILEDGNVVRVSDKGPGVENKQRAMEFGFSGAAPEALDRDPGGRRRSRHSPRGGRESRRHGHHRGQPRRRHGHDHLGVRRTADRRRAGAQAAREKVPGRRAADEHLERQQKVLLTVLECGEVGPSTVADRLEISVSTAYRDLSVLEEHGLVMADDSGKRLISPLGRDLVETIVNSWVK